MKHHLYFILVLLLLPVRTAFPADGETQSTVLASTTYAYALLELALLQPQWADYEARMRRSSRTHLTIGAWADSRLATITSLAFAGDGYFRFHDASEQHIGTRVDAGWSALMGLVWFQSPKVENLKNFSQGSPVLILGACIFAGMASRSWDHAGFAQQQIKSNKRLEHAILTRWTLIPSDSPTETALRLETTLWSSDVMAMRRLKREKDEFRAVGAAALALGMLYGFTFSTDSIAASNTQLLILPSAGGLSAQLLVRIK